MNKKLALFTGLGLIAAGVLGLLGDMGFSLPVFPLMWHIPALLWPLLVVGVGLLFVVPALLGRSRKLALLFIPGLPVLATGAILAFANTTGFWWAWSYLWPVEVTAVAAGFLLAGLRMRSIWPILPAILIGLNAVVLQFCALTGLWQSWAVLWSIEPLAIGLCLLLIAVKKHSSALLIISLVICGFAGVAFTSGAAIFLYHWQPLRLSLPLSLIAIGAVVLLFGLLRPRHEPDRRPNGVTA